MLRNASLGKREEAAKGKGGVGVSESKSHDQVNVVTPTEGYRSVSIQLSQAS